MPEHGIIIPHFSDVKGLNLIAMRLIKQHFPDGLCWKFCEFVFLRTGILRFFWSCFIHFSDLFSSPESVLLTTDKLLFYGQFLRISLYLFEMYEHRDYYMSVST